MIFLRMLCLIFKFEEAVLTPLPTRCRSLLSLCARHYDLCAIFFFFSAVYVGLVWIINGGDRWWVIDFVNNRTIFYGDDAYRFFLAKSAWLDSSLYTYNFVLPVNLFLEHCVVTLSGGDLFWSRCIHALIGGASLCFVWCCGLKLGFSKIVMVGAILVMGLMPLYAFVSLSFYGEAWLGFGLCFVMWLFVQKRLSAASLVMGLLPLIRIEGIFFLAPLWLYMVSTKRWRESIFILVPGLIYLLYLLVALPDLGDFSYWRFELRRLLSKILNSNDSSLLFFTYSFSLTVPSLLGLLFQPVRRMWPFVVGGFLWGAILQFSVLTRQAFYEPRYTYVLIPILVIMWAGFLSWGWGKIPWQGRPDYKKAIMTLIVSFLVITLNMGKLSLVEAAIKKNGWRWTAERVVNGEWVRIFPSYLPGYMDSYHMMSKKIYELLISDKSIDRLVMYDPFLYYFINPKMVPPKVSVDYPALGYLVFHFMLNGQIFTQHPGGRMYSYLRLSEPHFGEQERRVLYADNMSMPTYPYRWEEGPVELYLFSYKESDSPEIDHSEVPFIDPEWIKKIYKEKYQ